MEIKLKNIVQSIIENNYDNNEIINAWNQYCENKKKMENYVYNVLAQFNEEYMGKTPLDIAIDAHSGKFDPNEEYFAYDNVGLLVSFDYYNDPFSVVDIDELCDYIIKNNGKVDGYKMKITTEEIFQVVKDDYLYDICEKCDNFIEKVINKFCEENNIVERDAYNFDFNALVEYYRDYTKDI